MKYNPRALGHLSGYFAKALSFLALMGTPVASALPSIDRTAEFFDFQHHYQSIIFQDDADPNVFYRPLTRIEIVKNPNSGLPQFSMVYQPEGLVVMMAIKPRYDNPELEAVWDHVKAQNPQAILKDLPIFNGRFTPTIRTDEGLALPVKSNVQFGQAHQDPNQSANLMLLFPADTANLLVLALNGQGAFVLNYEYQYRAATTPTSLSIEFDWFAIESHLPSYIPNTILSPSAIEASAREMIESSAINIEIVEGSEDSHHFLVEAAKYLANYCFTPVRGNSGLDYGYKPNVGGCLIGPASIEIQTKPSDEFTAAAGFGISHICEKYPSLIRFKRGNDFVSGCPDGILATNPNPQAEPSHVDFIPDFLFDL